MFNSKDEPVLCRHITENLNSFKGATPVFLNLDLISGKKYVYLLTENSLVKVGVLWNTSNNQTVSLLFSQRGFRGWPRVLFHEEKQTFCVNQCSKGAWLRTEAPHKQRASVCGTAAASVFEWKRIQIWDHPHLRLYSPHLEIRGPAQRSRFGISRASSAYLDQLTLTPEISLSCAMMLLSARWVKPGLERLQLNRRSPTFLTQLLQPKQERQQPCKSGSYWDRIDRRCIKARVDLILFFVMG